MIVGIDPGSVSAAYGILDMQGRIMAVGDVPVVDRMVDAAGWNRELEIVLGTTWEPHAAIIEQVSAMPRQGVTSSFRFGMGVGLLRGVVTMRDISLFQVSPAKWKKHFNLTSDGEKSRALALRRWPGCGELSRKKDHGRAEALLLALYWLERIA